jgi:hypothetical protein
MGQAENCDFRLPPRLLPDSSYVTFPLEKKAIRLATAFGREKQGGCRNCGQRREREYSGTCEAPGRTR